MRPHRLAGRLGIGMHDRRKDLLVMILAVLRAVAGHTDQPALLVEQVDDRVEQGQNNRIMGGFCERPVKAIIEDVGKRPFITIGMASFVLLVPLAITSTQKMVRRLGGRTWSRLHKLVYVAAAGGVIHYYMLVKADTREPLLFGAALALVLIYRIVNKYLPRYTTRAQARQN